MGTDERVHLRHPGRSDVRDPSDAARRDPAREDDHDHSATRWGRYVRGRRGRLAGPLDLVRAAEDLADARLLEHRAEGRCDERRDGEDPQLRELLLLGDRDGVVTITCSIGASSSVWRALPEKISWVAPAKIGPAPMLASTFTPCTSVPAVSIMSSTITQGRPAMSSSYTRRISEILCAS